MSLLGLEGIEHRTTRVHTPRTNGFVERMNRTLLDECFRVAGRTTWYLEPAEIQRDLFPTGPRRGRTTRS